MAPESPVFPAQQRPGANTDRAYEPLRHLPIEDGLHTPWYVVGSEFPMRIDFSQTELMDNAFSDRPMTFCDPAPKNFLLAVLDLVAIETGNRRARENWQKAQLQNLLTHAHRRSTLWKRRIGKKVDKVTLLDLPILSRRDLIEQVMTEGSLLGGSDQIAVTKYSTSGSSGIPTEFFISAMNAEYNHIRTVAQYFMEGRNLAKNKTLLSHVPNSSKNGLVIERTGSWVAPLSSLFRTGQTKRIRYFHPDFASLVEELARDQIGYLISAPRSIEAILEHVNADFFAKSDTTIWLPTGAAVDPRIRENFERVGVPVLATYSSEEVGLIGSECPKSPGNYHVATSNVVVEVQEDDGFEIGGAKLGRVLVTHLHSYATPFIRYDVGDVASFTDRCPCGHDGPVLSNIYGRTKSLLKHQDGRISPFHVRDHELLAIVRCNEFRIRQMDLQTIAIELGGIQELSQMQHEQLTDLIRLHAGSEFKVIIKAVSSLDWGKNRKRLGFHNDLL
jgi:phenylacetate-coenzyme A ligase PaaK-like adenylate-forming protein